MKWVLFLSIVFIIYQILVWISHRALKFTIAPWLPEKWHKNFAIGFWLLSEAIIFLGLWRFWIHGIKIAASYLILLLYISMIAIVGKVILLICQRLLSQQASNRLQKNLRIFCPILLIGIMGYGIYAAYTPVVQHYSITVDKPMLKPVRIALASDTHLGLLVGKKQLTKLQQIVNHENADILVLAGDIMDDNVIEYHRLNLENEFSKLHAPLGVYAVMGNHDKFSHDSISQALNQTPIHLLQDDIVQIDSTINIIGRLDARYKNRATTASLVNKINNPHPILLIDHQPNEIKTNALTDIDIQMSGHAHGGQIFPATLIGKVIHYLDYGYLQENNKHFFVTSGFGFWAIPLRIGTQSEVMIIDINPSKVASQTQH